MVNLMIHAARQGENLKVARNVLRDRPEVLKRLLDSIIKHGALQYGSEEDYSEMNEAHTLVALGLAKYKHYRSDERFTIESTGLRWEQRRSI